MKNILALILTFLSCSLNAQDVISRTEIPDNAIAIRTSEVLCRSFSDRLVLSVSLFAISSPADTHYYIYTSITSMDGIKVGKNATCSTTTSKGEIIQMQSANNGTTTDQTAHLDNSRYFDVGTLFKIEDEVTIDYKKTQCVFPVSEEDLQKIMRDGVKSITISSSPEYHKDFKKDMVGKALKQCYDNIQKEIR